MQIWGPIIGGPSTAWAPWPKYLRLKPLGPHEVCAYECWCAALRQDCMRGNSHVTLCPFVSLELWTPAWPPMTLDDLEVISSAVDISNANRCNTWSFSLLVMDMTSFFTERRCAMALYMLLWSGVCPSVCHTPVLYRTTWYIIRQLSLHTPW